MCSFPHLTSSIAPCTHLLYHLVCPCLVLSIFWNAWMPKGKQCILFFFGTPERFGTQQRPNVIELIRTDMKSVQIHIPPHHACCPSRCKQSCLCNVSISFKNYLSRILSPLRYPPWAPDNSRRRASWKHWNFFHPGYSNSSVISVLWSPFFPELTGRPHPQQLVEEIPDPSNVIPCQDINSPVFSKTEKWQRV